MNTQDAKRWPIVEVVDPSEKRGLWCCWFAFSPQDFVFLVRAKHIPDGSFDTMATAVKNERSALPRWPVLAIMDARGGLFVSNRDQNRNFFHEFHDRGLHYMESVESSLPQLHDWLRVIHRPELERDVPKLRICASAVREKENPLWALERFVWDPTKPKSYQYRQAGKDWVDCMRYLAGYPGLTYRRLVGKQELREPGLAESYSEPTGSPGVSGDDLESILWRRGLTSEGQSLAESYESTTIRQRGSPF